MTLVYLTLEQAIDTHRRTIEISGGGMLGHLDIGRLEGVLQNIQNDEWYPTFIEKLSHLFFGTNQFHCFADGNKRLSISLCTQMLLLNGYVFVAAPFIHAMENISYHVAAGRINKPLLQDIVAALLEDEFDDNEELKLRILHAINGVG